MTTAGDRKESARGAGLEPFEPARHRPRLSPTQAEEIARRRFAVRGEARELPSERDQNFRIAAEEGSAFVLKISREGEDRSVLEFQHAALRAVASRASDLAAPRPCASREGGEIVEVGGPEGGKHLVRLFPWIPGVPFARVRPHSPDLLASLGRYLGRLDRALSSVEHPAMDRALPWNLLRAAGEIEARREAIGDPARRRLVDRVLARFREETEPRLARLPRAVVHHDANDHNVLVDERPGAQRVCGLVDYGDLVRSVRIAEPAVAAAYAMLGKRDPLAAAARVLAGYHEAFPLSEEEVDLLFDLACLRLCVSVAISAFQRRGEPANEYLSISEAPAWDLLGRLAETPPAFARAGMRDAVGLEPCDRSRAVVAWLGAHGGSCGPVIEPDPSREPVHVVDLSVSSPSIADLPDSVGAADLGARIDALLREAGARIGIGRYDEPRRLYAGERFALPGEDGPERRTIHLGIDLFVEAGAAVRAPLDGEVHSFADNAIRGDYGPTILLRHAPAEGVEFFTLYGHLERGSLEGLEVGRRLAKGDRIGSVGAPPANGGWPPHLHFQVIADLLGHEGDYPGVARARERAVWRSLCPDPNLVLRLPALEAGDGSPGREELLAARRRLAGASVSLAYRRPLVLVRGHLQHVYDDVGRRYLDAVNNVPHVGHSHPRVVRAAQEQMAVLNTNTRYLHPNFSRYAERLVATLPRPLEVCFFVCSGSEANELALRLARAATGGTEWIVLEGGYHGNTTSLVDLSSYKFRGPGGSGPPPNVHEVPMPDPYRGPFRREDSEAGAKYAALVRDAAARVRASGKKLAGFLAEPLLGCGGQIVPPAGYLREAYRAVREAGGVCVADEVQLGFGRVGTHFWAFEAQGAVPDLVTLGKPIGNGHPLGAVVTTRAIADAFAAGMEYFNTFGGNPVSCAIGLAVLDVLRDEGLQDRARRTGGRFLSRLEALKERHPLIGDVRGQGLFLGVELVEDRETRAPAAEGAAHVVERMKDKGVLTSADGPSRNVLKIKPPLVFTERDADLFCEALDEVLGESVLAGDPGSAARDP